MYESHYQLTCDPFRLTPRGAACFGHSSYAKSQAYMLYALQRGEGLLLVTGLPGTGKTSMVRDCIAQYSALGVEFVEIASGHLDAEDVIYLAASKFGIALDDTRKVVLLCKLEAHLQHLIAGGKRAVLVIDEAQSLTDQALDEIKNLANLEFQGKPALQIFLVGQRSLRDRLQQSQLSQVFQRITAACEIKPMSGSEQIEYISHCLQACGWQGRPIIEDSVHSILFWHTGGIPRRINLICSRLLLRGMVQNLDRLGREHLEVVLDDLQNEGLVQLSDISENR